MDTTINNLIFKPSYHSKPRPKQYDSWEVSETTYPFNSVGWVEYCPLRKRFTFVQYEDTELNSQQMKDIGYFLETQDKLL